MNDSHHDPQLSGIINKLLVAVKISSLYPSHHHMLVSCRDDLYRVFQSYLEKCSRLVIVVDKSRLVSDGHILHEGNLNKENLAFLLYRDGIKWISFDSGMEKEELSAFLDILNRYRMDEEYDGGDIVTALWQANFSGIKYDTDDLLWKDDPVLDISRLKVIDVDRSNRAHETPEQRDAESLASPEHPKTLWELTEKEKELTRRMIADHDQRDADADVFDILLIILNEQNDKEDYAAVLDLVRECFQHTLIRGEFSHGVTFLKNLRRIYARYEKDGFWAKAHLDDFYLMISGKHLQSGLKGFLNGRKNVSKCQLIALRQLISLLPPQCVTSLGRLLPEVNHPAIRRCLMEAMGIQALRNTGPLASLAGSEDEKVAHHAISLLSCVKKPRALNTLRRLIRSGRESTRIAAVKALIRHPHSKIKDFNGILEDDSPTVVNLFLDYLGRKRDTVAEDMVAARLASGRFARQDRDLVVKLYEILGRCGSERSLSFLRRQLFRMMLITGTMGRTHKLGAAVALFYLKQGKADSLLGHGAKSIRFSVRHACRHAMEITGEPENR